MNSIRHRLLFFLLIAGFVPLAIVIVTTHTVIRREVMKSETAKVSDISLLLSRHVTEVMDRVGQDLGTIKTQPLLRDPDVDVEVEREEMLRIVGVHDIFDDLSSYDANGALICSTNASHPVFKEYSAWFEKALSGQTVISPPERKLGEDDLFIMVYLPVIAEDQTIQKVIKARLSFHRIMSFFNSVKVGEQGYVALLDEWGYTICGPNPGELLSKFDDRIPVDHWTDQPTGDYTDPFGRPFLYSAQPLLGASTGEGSKWILVAMKPMEEVSAVLAQSQITLAWAVTAMVLIAASLGIFLARNISQPIENAGRIAREVAAGNLEVQMETKGPHEIQHMADSFNQMTAEVKRHRAGLESEVQARTRSLVESQEELERTDLHLKCALDSTNNGLVVEGADGQINLVNQLFLDLFDLEADQIAGHGFEEVFEDALARASIIGETAEMWEEARRPMAVVDRELVFESPVRRYLEIHSAPIRDRAGKIIGRVWTLREITENRLLEESLRQSQKMEAIGQLAGGVAHDFNNLLTGVVGNISLIELNPNSPIDARNRELLTSALTAADRATELVKKLLGFSRRSHMDLKPCKATNVLTEVRDLLVATIDPSIEIDVTIDESPWGVMADPNLLSQVIMNMAVNAKDSLAGRKDGRISLRSSNQSLEETEGKLQNGLRAGDYVCLTVEDNGSGIPEAVQKRIFEPFFTTKDPGKGTGLGLATSFGIVKQLGGSLHFESTEGEGTRFDIFLPRSAVAEAQPAATRKKVVSELDPNNNETLLLVDDEDLVRSVGVSLLDKLGYRTLVASSGREALEVFEAHESEIDLVILDLTMPGLSGTDTLRELRKQFEYTPVLICSGYLVEMKEIEKESGSCPDGFVQKPYQIETMSETIREILKLSRGKAA